MSVAVRRSRLLATVALAMGVLSGVLPAANAVPVPSDPASPSAGTLTSAAPAPVRVPDLVDRAWPKNPPWDACPRPVWPGERSTGSPGEGRRVLILGDSLTRESRVLTARGMRTSGWTPTFRCWGSRRLDWGLAQVARARQLGQLPSVVMLALGTNDISWETPQTTERRVRLLLDRLGPKRQVIWVDLHLTRSAWLNARADWFNAMIRRLADRRRNLTVVPWHRIARAHGIHGWDGIHYGPSGYRLRARTLIAALDAVGRRHPVAAPAPIAPPTPIATTDPATPPVVTTPSVSAVPSGPAPSAS